MAKTIEDRVLESLRLLPEPYQVEALDFIEFLKERRQIAAPPDAITPQERRSRVFERYDEIRRRGGPQIEEVVKKLGGPWLASPNWNSTDFIRRDRDSH